MLYCGEVFHKDVVCKEALHCEPRTEAQHRYAQCTEVKMAHVKHIALLSTPPNFNTFLNHHASFVSCYVPGGVSISTG